MVVALAIAGSILCVFPDPRQVNPSGAGECEEFFIYFLFTRYVELQIFSLILSFKGIKKKQINNKYNKV